MTATQVGALIGAKFEATARIVSAHEDDDGEREEAPPRASRGKCLPPTKPATPVIQRNRRQQNLQMSGQSRLQPATATTTPTTNYHRRLVRPLLLFALLLEWRQASGAATQPPSHVVAVERRQLTMLDPATSVSAAAPHNFGQRPNYQAPIAAEERRRLLSLAMGELMRRRSREQMEQRSLWSHEPSLVGQADQQQQQHFVSYRPAAAAAPPPPASTMASISRQIQPPPNPFYELSFAPTNALQIEHLANNNNQATDEQEPHFVGASSQPSPLRLEPPNQQQQLSPSTTARSIELPHQFEQNFQQQQQQSEVDGRQTAESADNNNNKASGESRNSQQQQQQQEQQQQQTAVAASTDKIEPRQRRRLFNRILKKAEWNHLFVELSKVLLRYFLDLALKDIIGKQSGAGSSAGSSSGTETTPRKKLDAQSELADLLKEFVKNAISNI